MISGGIRSVYVELPLHGEPCDALLATASRATVRGTRQARLVRLVRAGLSWARRIILGVCVCSPGGYLFPFYLALGRAGDQRV